PPWRARAAARRRGAPGGARRRRAPESRARVLAPRCSSRAGRRLRGSARVMLHLHALRAARARQLRARALRPLARRRFPDGEPPRTAEPVPAARALWSSPAFEASSPPDASTRLGRFHRQYGDDVLAAARAGELEE